MAVDGWAPPTCPPGWVCVSTVEMHTGGEPLRIAVDGLPALEGRTVLARRRAFRERHDALRTALMWEPRGHADMYGAVLTPPNETTPGEDGGGGAPADFGVFFIHNEGYSTMCGHAVIALTKFAVETGYLAAARRAYGGDGAPPHAAAVPVTLDAPCGRIRAVGHLDAQGKVARTTFLNVPSFVLHRGKAVDVPGVGAVRYDVAYGGAFYAIVDAAAITGHGCDDSGLILDASNAAAISTLGRAIKRAVIADAAATPIEHPFEPDLSFLYGTIFTGPPRDPANHSRNVCVFADGEVDRSPTGSGVSARAALHHARGELPVGAPPITIESILGTTMTVAVASAAAFGPHAAVVPEVAGAAWFCGRNELWIDPEDPLSDGFFVR
eukprot:TRINITY_DN25526_c0_g1_i1.p1 TRINITY_DN25526_c0_g1~~TRINITY_DN25526_c0_g1_i1.p1  ORF type:complete len:382 (+),score=101.99 TRINITY_DN25526_c0_g1_i1:63-1208(+)